MKDLEKRFTAQGDGDNDEDIEMESHPLASSINNVIRKCAAQMIILFGESAAG